MQDEIITVQVREETMFYRTYSPAVVHMHLLLNGTAPKMEVQDHNKVGKKEVVPEVTASLTDVCFGAL